MASVGIFVARVAGLYLIMKITVGNSRGRKVAQHTLGSAMFLLTRKKILSAAYSILLLTITTL